MPLVNPSSSSIASLVPWALGLAALTACGGEAGGPTTGQQAQPGPQAVATEAQAIDANLTAARRHLRSTLAGDLPPDSPAGFVAFDQCSQGECATDRLGAVYALFYTTPDQTCSVALTDGACSVLSCTNQLPVSQSAGDLTLTGLRAGTKTLLPERKNSLFYQWVKSGGTATQVRPGIAVAASASGSTVPAFGPVSLVPPPLVHVSKPKLPASGGTLAISTGSALPVAWTGGEGGAYMIVTISTSSAYAQCNFAATDGADTVPQDILASLGTGSATFEWGQYVQTAFSAGAYAVTESVDEYGQVSASLE